MQVSFYKYTVFDDGRVFAHGNASSNYEPILLATRVTDGGYLKVNLTMNGKRRRVLVHRLVAHLFLGLDLDNQNIDVHHKNKIRSDNRCDNLELVSSASHFALHTKDNVLVKYPNDTKLVKECRKCRVIKLRSEFYIRSINSDGTSSWCKSCCSNV